MRPEELIIDNFAGGGGASTGIELALGRPVDIAINHDPAAIAMHMANHPQTLHYCKDVFEVSPRGGATGHAMESPMHTVTAGGKPARPSTGNPLALVTSHVMKMKGTNIGHGTDEPLHTVTSRGLHFGEVRAFLVKYYGTEQDPALREPLHTVTTKDRFGLVTVAGEDYAIVDIGMRMLTPRELFRAQGFPDTYIIDPIFKGKPLSKTEQVAKCGNSVCPDVASALVRANVQTQRMEKTA